MIGKRVSYWRGLGNGVAAAVVLACATGSADARAPLPARMQPVTLDSGTRANSANEPRLVFSHLLDLGPEVPWVRVLFDPQGTQLPPGSVIRVTSLLDGESHVLDAAELEKWGYGTAFFNGSAVQIELVAARNTTGNAFRIREVFAGERPAAIAVAGLDETPVEGGVAAICGDIDNRQPFPNSFDSQAMGIGRLLPGGINSNEAPRGYCTAFIIDRPAGIANPDKVHLTAGHCFGAQLGNDINGNLGQTFVLQFNAYCDAPEQSTCSNDDCTIKHPAVTNQFPVRGDTVIARNPASPGFSAPGNDWAVFKCGLNSEGKTTWERQRDRSEGTRTDWAFTLASAVTEDMSVRITG
ncbi:MAG: hypothetical protein Q7R41_07205 [Phycisphaerales bacterium]|nr:hypothetical protein [Phycisphaerales bacterium]